MSNTTLTNLARYDRGSMPGEAEITDEGYIKAKAIVTRCGVFLYKNADGTVRKELRHPDEVLRIDSLESMKMIPVVNGHPPERLVTAENAKRLAVGFTGECVEQNMPYIMANLLVTDKGVVEEIKGKKRNELSLGYTVDLVSDPGLYYGEPYDFIQTNIRYNHLAIVDQARAGPEARIALDGEDAFEIPQNEAEMARQRKVKIDTEEYMLEGDAANSVEKMMEKYSMLMKEMEGMKMMMEKMTAERDSMRDKDMHNPAMEHQEKDEIGPDGKEKMDPVDLYGMQSHVRDYTPPSKMENHAVMSPKNEHYPMDLPRIAKVDSAEFQKIVKNRVNLEKIADRYLDRETLNRMDGLSDIEIKKKIIISIQKKAALEGKSDAYINARFDSVLEDLPREKVLANPSGRVDERTVALDNADADSARARMIKRQKETSIRRT